MADLIIKPATGTGNKLIVKDMAGGAVLTTADSGATIANSTLVAPALGTPASGNLSNTTGGGGLKSQQKFTSSGTWTKPSGITSIKVYVTGGGGGGGAKGNGTDNGGGGGAGGTAVKIIDVSAISSVTVTIGPAGEYGEGSGRGQYGDGQTGGTSSFGSHCGATGGGGGHQGNGGGVFAGLGGVGSNGDFNLNGDAGSGGRDDGGEVQYLSAGRGGSSFWGGAGRGAVYDNVGGPGYQGGGGGGGSSWGSRNAGSGGAGFIVVEEYR